MKNHQMLLIALSDDLSAQLIEVAEAYYHLSLPSDLKHARLVEFNRHPQFGHLTSNIAMRLARICKLSPMVIAQAIVDHMPRPKSTAKCEVKAPGYINFYLADSYIQDFLIKIHQQHFQTILPSAPWKKVHLEYVSANPTGPIHVGHGRGAAAGASLAALLQAVGCQVHQEYYVNNVGRQMQVLALSVWLRYLAQVGQPVDLPAGCYQGQYIDVIAQKMASDYKERFFQPHAKSIALMINQLSGSSLAGEDLLGQWILKVMDILGDELSVIRQLSCDQVLSGIRQDLESFGVQQHWFLEHQLHDQGKIQAFIGQLEKENLVFEQDGALWFNSKQLGDEKNRVLRRQDGTYTYFAADTAYHVEKLSADYDLCIAVFGADHHGHADKMHRILKSLLGDTSALKFKLVQFVSLIQNSERVAMSTRADQFITLKSLYSEVGVDATRFFYVARRLDQHVDFDLDLAKSQSMDNPVYYIQYAHARIHQILSSVGVSKDSEKLYDDWLAQLTHPKELALIHHSLKLPWVIEQSVRDLEVHALAHYLIDLAKLFHQFYAQCPVLVDSPKQKQARIALIICVARVIAFGLSILGVSAPKKM
ncbi:arginine--tRNA ligase [Gammaproteobacteria bacterium]|nr:arginine--tRNA ligase [Gammaproteobacteria bacterium]